MGRRLKLVNPTRYAIPVEPCVVAGCTTPPRAGTLLCVFHARALQHLAEKETNQ